MTSLSNLVPQGFNLEVIRVNQGPVWGLLRYPEINQRIQVLLQLSMILNLCTSELHFVFQISQPPNIAQKWFCIQILRMDLSSQGNKQFVNLLHGLKVTTILVIKENSGVYF